ncbi:hypothetical protein MLD38_034507 [Melastoma candidum]|uniref:Uncharacterized protein n=1 Tax=Melastoma candidum TaxID=119954 RepID=A0ACB9MC24_9MYRT|nr:hypothetical protein MLD38_034507 [Melastoma candidum]
MAAMASELEDRATVSKLKLARDDLNGVLQASKHLEGSLKKTDTRMHLVGRSLTSSSKRVAHIQTLSMANKALDTRINRAVTPALSLLETFRSFESLQGEIMLLSKELSRQKPNHDAGGSVHLVGYEDDRLRVLAKYVDCVDRMKEAIGSIIREGEPTILKLQEAVEFLSRTKATDQFRAHRLRETLVTLNALYETEVDKMRFDGLLDESLLRLQDEFEGLLHRLKHRNIRSVIKHDDGSGNHEEDQYRMAVVDMKMAKEKHGDLGSNEEVEVLRRISAALAGNDCLDICIDIFVKVRYRRAAKALMRLNPEYLRTYTPEEIDEMEWETLEMAITLWIQHFELALKNVFVSEKQLSNRVMGGVMDGLVWLECFVKIADKIMAVFFRFGEGVARGTKERPEKLFKLLDMFDALERIKPEFSLVFEGESGRDICTRFRELEKLLVHAGSKVLWEFGLQIEGDSDGLPPPPDGSVPKLVRYAINYLKYLVTATYCAPMTRVLRTEQTWKTGIQSKPEPDKELLRDAVSNMMEALQRNVESKRSWYKDKALANVFAMNTYWYIYMRTRNTELGKLLGDKYMKKRYKVAAEEAAYLYQKQSWRPIAKILDQPNPTRNTAEDRAEGFVKAFEEMAGKHRSVYVIQEEDLREQMKEATVKVVVPVVVEFVKSHGAVLPRSYGDGDSVGNTIREVFDACGKIKRNNRDGKEENSSSMSGIRRSRSDFS